MRVYDLSRLGHSGFYVEHAREGIGLASTTAPHWSRNDDRYNLSENGYLYLPNYYAVYT